jgi:3-oxocholest-4-en-26-oyl-CoA dehydrogenase alpha subunit
MECDYTPEEQELRSELRAYFADIMTPEVRAAPEGSPLRKDVLRRMGQDGWLAIGWPVEYGGRGMSAIEQYILSDEAQHAGAPQPGMALSAVAPAILHFGTEEQKERFLPPILRGEIEVAIGYSEPDAGTDLASLKTRAVRDGDEYVINGQKIFTTIADYADYVWLAARTDPDAPKHKGISMFLVPTDAPGFSYTPIHTIVGHTTFATYYENVRLPATALVGKENEGWYLITAQLNLERSGIGSSRTLEDAITQVRTWAQQTTNCDGVRIIDLPWVRMSLARVQAKVAALTVQNRRVAWSIANGQFDAAAASCVKVFGTEFAIEAYRLLLEIVGQAGYITEGSPGAVLNGRLEYLYRNAFLTTFGGGVNEIQREIIAQLALGMPRAPR